jgi:hypothetical protein
VEHRFTKVVICEYCAQPSRIQPEGLDPTGEKGELIDFESVLSVGARIELQGNPATVLGCLRYKYDEGFWDEWFIGLDSGKKLWLQEDEGEFTLYEKENLTAAVPAFEGISVGSMLPVNDMSVFVTEKSSAVIAGGKGQLSFRVIPGEKVQCVDGNAGGQLVAIEFAPDEINLSIGKEIPLEEIKVL